MRRDIATLLMQHKAMLEAALGLDSGTARIEVQMLLQRVLGVGRAYLLAHPEQVLTVEQQSSQEDLLQRRLRGEPIAHILGEREFFGLTFKVTPDTLIPRPDTELLVELALQRIPPPQPSGGATGETTSHLTRLSNYASQVHPQGVRRGCKGLKPQQHTQAGYPSGRGSVRLLDLGTGSGAIALSIARMRPDAEVIAVDAAAPVLAVARENAQRLNITTVSFLQSDWFYALGGQSFDLIVSNPPYVAAGDEHLTRGDVRFEPLSALASGADGLDDIRRIASQAGGYLENRGWLLLEHGYDQGAAVRDLLQQNEFLEVFSAKDIGGIERVSGGMISR